MRVSRKKLVVNLLQRMSTRAGSYEEIQLEELQQETDEGHSSQPASQLGLCSAAVPLRLIDFYFLELSLVVGWWFGRKRRSNSPWLLGRPFPKLTQGNIEFQKMKLEVKNMKLYVGFWSEPTMTKIVRWLASSFDPHLNVPGEEPAVPYLRQRK